MRLLRVFICIGLLSFTDLPVVYGNLVPSLFTGEKIEYDIKKLGVKAGEASLHFHGIAELDQREVYLIVFRATAFNFLDEERIYIDPQTFMPIQVTRDLNIFGKKEQIIEYYESHKGIVRIVKTVNGKTVEQIIEKEGELDNIYCFIYRYRRDGKFELDDTLAINLPTKDVQIILKKEQTLNVAGQKFDSYYMESVPKKYKVWFANQENKIPLRIDGAVGISSTAMVMTDYQKGTLQQVANTKELFYGD